MAADGEDAYDEGQGEATAADETYERWLNDEWVEYKTVDGAFYYFNTVRRLVACRVPCVAAASPVVRGSRAVPSHAVLYVPTPPAAPLTAATDHTRERVGEARPRGRGHGCRR